MNFRRGIHKIVFALIIIGGISGMIASVGLVLHLHNATHDNCVYPKDLHDVTAKEYTYTKLEKDDGIDFQPETPAPEKLDFQPEQTLDFQPESKIETVPKVRLVELCVVAGLGVAGCFLILFAFYACRAVCSTICLAVRKSVFHITDALHYGGKQMLCDIIKWTIIIIIAAIVFLIVHCIITPSDRSYLH